MIKPAARRERVHLATRAEILDTARQQIAQLGASALSLRGIARQMGLSAPALYRYFQDRSDLVTALIVEAFTSLAETLEAARDRRAAAGRRERLLAIFLAYRYWALAHPQDYALIFGAPIPGYAAPEAQIEPPADRAMGVIVGELVAAYASGAAAPAPAYTRPSPALQKQLNAWKKRYGEAAPTAALHLALVAWTRAHGLLSIELFGQLESMLSDPADLYRAEAQQVVELALQPTRR